MFKKKFNSLLPKPDVICLFLLLLSLSRLGFTSDSKDLFAPEFISQWQAHRFNGATRYDFIDANPPTVLRAESQGSASGLYLMKKIDLLQTPYLNWSWRVDKPLLELAEQNKSGDDFSARVYVIIDGGWWFWRTRAISYVWSSQANIHSPWPNPYVGRKAMMIALRSGQDQPKTWYHEKRHILQDFETIFGEHPRYIDAVAIMTDTDDSQTEALSYYRQLYFSAD